MPPKINTVVNDNSEEDVENAINYQHFLNDLTKARKPSPLRELVKLVKNKEGDTITLAIGSPNSETFPLVEINAVLKDGTKFTINGENLQHLLQYLPSNGYAPLIKTLEKWQDKLHGKQRWDKRQILFTTGSQEGIKLTTECLMSYGDPVIFQHPAYAGAIDLFKPYRADFILAEQDKDGIVPELLEEKLKQRLKDRKPMPKLFYINPTGANPNGSTLPNERRIRLYELARIYNLLILEDDPYFFIDFSQGQKQSFLTLDTDGRVLRFDSFSKTYFPGMRTGFITGPTTLIRIIEINLQGSTLHSCSLAQAIVYNILEEWGEQKTLQNMEKIKQFYLLRRNYALQEAEKYLKDVAEWDPPSGGMFLWLRVKGLDCVRNLTIKKCLEKSVVVTPGYIFTEDATKPHSYVRISYGYASLENISKGIQLLAEAIKEELLEKQNSLYNK